MLTKTPNGLWREERPGAGNRLNVILYVRDSDILKAIEEAFSRVIPAVRIEFCRTIETFVESLRKLAYDRTVAVIVVTDRSDLENITSLQRFLLTLRTILVLPDGDDQMVAMAHSLRPRFVSHHEDDFTNVVAVLNKMLAELNSKPRME